MLDIIITKDEHIVLKDVTILDYLRDLHICGKVKGRGIGWVMNYRKNGIFNVMN